MGDMVAINVESIDLMIKMFKKDNLDKDLFRSLMRTKGIKEFINHEKSMGRFRLISPLKDEIKRVIEDKEYEDVYDFYILKNNLEQLEIDIKNILKNSNSIIEEAKEKVYEIVPKDIQIRTSIYLYWGGIDGAFTLNRKEIFINYRKYFGDREEFIKVLSHEMYHARKLTLMNRIKYCFRMISRDNRLLYDIIGRTIEEGMALVVQHGPNLTKDDLTGMLTKWNILFVKEEFQHLNSILNSIRRRNGNSITKRHLNIYVIGYCIVSLIYKERGIEILNYWTVDLNLRRIIREYVELNNRNKTSSNLDKNIIRWILKERSI